jgi:hypothetical protein
VGRGLKIVRPCEALENESTVSVRVSGPFVRDELGTGRGAGQDERDCGLALSRVRSVDGQIVHVDGGAHAGK